ncbi:MAG: translation initiation factor IF-2 N-terminal domain-containing protein, partial [Rikenellaceae bacterium]
MANEKKIRLLAIARQLNVGSGTLVDFLNNHGYAVEGGNQLLDDSMIASVEKEFGKGKIIERVNIKEKIKTKNETVSLDDINKTKQSGSVDSEYVKDELFIKTNIVDKIDHIKLNTPKVVGKIDLNAIGKPVVKSPASKPQPYPVKQKTKPVEKNEVKVTDKKINSNEHVSVHKPVVANENTSKKVETAVVENQVKVQENSKNPQVDLNKTFDDRRAESKQDLFRINSSDIAGPKIIGKIDLNSFEKKKSDNSDKNKKNKRKRIKKDNKVDINDPKNSSQSAQKGGANRPAGAPNQQGGQRNQQGGANRPHGNGNNGANNRPGGASHNNNNNKNAKHLPKAPVVKAEVTDDDVQKQIKDTLARLTSKGNKTKSSKYRKDKRDAVSARASEEMERQEAEKSVLKLTEFVTVSDLARMMDVSVTEIITACMNLGLMVSINQRLDAEAIVIVAEEFGYKVEFVTVEIQEQITDEVDSEEDLIPRSPIVTVMGHVDHGKTSLLDFIRKANVIAGEAGGITQHIGAYSVKVNDEKRITFLDTPGHEAFTAMRARGAKVTDVAIIIIAADDSVMPQTIEAINHASAAGVPIIFAINKIDKPGANPDKIREQLSAMNYLVEDWGGKYQCQEIAAKSGVNVDLLLEKIILESEMLELKANPNRKSSGVII